ncbi:MAG: ABC transporter ATP-binding protein [Bacteroidota bacterium]
MKPIIKAVNLSKAYRLDGQNKLSDKSSWLSKLKPFNKVKPENILWALQDVNFEVFPGDILGLIGPNGAGKTTLLKILSRITRPTSGYVDVNGKLGSLLEVGTGFHPYLTGRENVYFYGMLLGMSRREVTRHFDEIIAFSGTERFIDVQLNRYSSGMQVRLAFSVAAHLRCDILLLDEVLSIGDEEFQKRSFNKVNELIKDGRTVILVSHNLPTIQRLSSKVLLLREGQVKIFGEVQVAISAYLNTLDTVSRDEINNSFSIQSTGNSQGFEITAFYVFVNRQAVDHLVCGQETEFKIEYKKSDHTEKIRNIRIRFWSHLGLLLTDLDTSYSDPLLTYHISNEGWLKCQLERFPLKAGRYSVEIVINFDRETDNQTSYMIELDVKEGDFFQSGLVIPFQKEESHPVLVPHKWTVKGLD